MFVFSSENHFYKPYSFKKRQVNGDKGKKKTGKKKEEKGKEEKGKEEKDRRREEKRGEG